VGDTRAAWLSFERGMISFLLLLPSNPELPGREKNLDVSPFLIFKDFSSFRIPVFFPNLHLL
jgi:hypothetical protein